MLAGKHLQHALMELLDAGEMERVKQDGDGSHSAVNSNKVSLSMEWRGGAVTGSSRWRFA